MAKIKANILNFIFIIISFLTINSQNSVDDNDTLVLNFYLDKIKVYSVEETDGNFKIVVYEIIHCNEAPCPLPIIDEKIIDNEEDCQILKTLFDLYLKNDIKQNSLFYDELPEEQMDMILMVLEKNKLFTILKYEILNNSEKHNNKYKKKGFTFENEEGSESVICTIAMGEKPSGGYSIGIKKIKIKGSNASIYVTEKVPRKDEMVTDAITYPIAQVKFNQSPSFVEVRNYDTGDIFQRIFI